MLHHQFSAVTQSCPTLYDPIDGSPPGSPVPGILQARTLEWVATSFSTEYYSAIKENEIMPSAATWMDLNIIILSEMSQIKKTISNDITYLWNLKK